MPRHALGVAEGNGQRNLWRRIERRVGLGQTAERTRSAMRGWGAGLIVQAALFIRTVADDGGRQRIGHSLTGRPTRGNRRQHLHHQGEQDQG